MITDQYPVKMRLRRTEMIKHFDSHHHLVSQYATEYLRPVILEATVKAGSGEDAWRIDADHTSVAAALVRDTSILISDMATMKGVEAHDVNVIYLVFKSDHNLDPMEYDAGPDKYKIYYHVQTVEEAFAHIRSKLQEVSEQASTKEPYKLTDLLWSFMMSREIRVIGNFTHLARSLPYADIVQVSSPSTGAKEIFQTKSLGKGAFPHSNLVRVLQVYLDHPALVEKTDTQFDDPYLALARQNYHAPWRRNALHVKLRRHHKNRLNQFDHDVLADTAEELVILSLSDYKNIQIENALVLLITDCEFINSTTMAGSNVVNSFKTFHAAVSWIMDCLRSGVTPKLNKASQLKYIKTIHVLTDVIDDAH